MRKKTNFTFSFLIFLSFFFISFCSNDENNFPLFPFFPSLFPPFFQGLKSMQRFIFSSLDFALSFFNCNFSLQLVIHPSILASFFGKSVNTTFCHHVPILAFSLWRCSFIVDFFVGNQTIYFYYIALYCAVKFLSRTSFGGK